MYQTAAHYFNVGEFSGITLFEKVTFGGLAADLNVVTSGKNKIVLIPNY